MRFRAAGYRRYAYRCPTMGGDTGPCTCGVGAGCSGAAGLCSAAGCDRGGGSTHQDGTGDEEGGAAGVRGACAKTGAAAHAIRLKTAAGLRFSLIIPALIQLTLASANPITT